LQYKEADTERERERERKRARDEVAILEGSGILAFSFLAKSSELALKKNSKLLKICVKRKMGVF
jgi:hypothetical protein